MNNDQLNLNYDTVTKSVDNSLECCCAHIECRYIIKPFILSMHIMHDFINNITVIIKFQIKHSHFNVDTSRFKQLDVNQQHSHTNESNYVGNISIISSCKNLQIRREILLKISTSLNRNKNSYSMKINIIKGPSRLNKKQFIITDIMDNEQVIKSIFWTTVYFKYNIDISTNLLSLIFDVYLLLHCGYFWMDNYEKPLLYHSLQFDKNIVAQIPNGYDTFDLGIAGKKGNKSKTKTSLLTSRLRDFYQQKRQRDKTIIKQCKYVLFNDVGTVYFVKNTKSVCIAINIEIEDKKRINSAAYIELFEMFKYYQLFEPQLSAIWPLNNPSKLYDLNNLYKGIEIHCNGNELEDEIKVNAMLLIKPNGVDILDNDNHVAMVWVDWIETYINLKDELIDEYEYEYLGFDELVCFYKDYIDQECVHDIITFIQNDDKDFGEAFIALMQFGISGIGNIGKMYKYKQIMNALNVNSNHNKQTMDVKSVNDIGKYMLNEVNSNPKYKSQMKRKYKKNLRKHQNKLYKNRYPNKYKKFTYARW